MDHSSVLDNDFRASQGLQVDSVAQGYLAETAKWGKFLAILGFIGSGFMVLAGIVMMLFGSFIGDSPELAATPFASGFGALMGVFYILIAVVYIMPALYLFRFCDRTKKALATNDTPVLTDAFGQLKSLYKFMGVLAAIFIGLYALIFIFAIVGGGIAALAS